MTKERANDRHGRMAFRQRSIMFIATGGGIGNLPVAPGTFGTLPGLALAAFLSTQPLYVYWIVMLLTIGAGTWSAHLAENIVGGKDPKKVVIDEIAGMLVALVGHPVGWTTALTAFGLFRLFDVAKPFPVGWLDKHLKGGVGIMADDVAAGVMANIVLWLLRMVVPL